MVGAICRHRLLLSRLVQLVELRRQIVAAKFIAMFQGRLLDVGVVEHEWHVR